MHIWEWILNFTGIHYGENSFATHMYNFWSGFGGDITEFAIIGTLITIYRHHVKNSRMLNHHLLEAMREKVNHKSEQK